MQQNALPGDETIRTHEPCERLWQTVSLQKILLRAASAYQDSEQVSMWESWPNS